MNENAHSTTIHVLLQGKGGVGKSLIASFLAQYFTSRGHAVRCIDADPVNCTFSQYGRLNVQRLRVLPNGGIDAAFDALMETLFKDHGTFVIDSGATTFIPLWNRLSQRDVIAALNNVNRHLYIHYIITGFAQGDTVEGLRRIVDETSMGNIILWVNEFFGRVDFLEKAISKELPGRVVGSVAVQRRNPDTFGRDIEDMLVRKQTFDEAIESSETLIMAKERLKIVRRDLFEQLDNVPLCPRRASFRKERAS